jgi:hypothetical protein
MGCRIQVPSDTRRRRYSRSFSDRRHMGKWSSNGPLQRRGETRRVMVVSTVRVRMGEPLCVDGLPVSGLAIDGRTVAVSATDCGVRAEMVVSTAVVRMGEGACVDGLTVSGPKYHAIDGVGRTAAVSATDGGWVG